MYKKTKEEKSEGIRLEGQITIALALVLMIIVSLLLSTVEAARATALEVRMECAVQTALYSLFSQYHRELAEQYDLLFIDSSFQTDSPSIKAMEGQLEYYMENNCRAPSEQFFLMTRDWYGITEETCAIEGVRLATDSMSPMVYQQAVAYMKDLVNMDLCDDIQSWITVCDECGIDAQGFEEENAKKVEEAQQSYSGDGEWTITQIYPELDVTKLFDGKDISWFAGDGKGISFKSINLMNTYSFRNKNQGSSELAPKMLADPLQDIYFNEYILLKLGHYADVPENGVLDYQSEYVICGTGSDAGNLLLVCELLFFLRSAANIIPLMQSEEAKGIIDGISSLALLLEIPPEVVKPLLYMFWAALEGLFDTRSILQGERVPLLKDYADFTVSLNGIGSLGDSLYQKKEGGGTIADGLAYEDYLRIFLLTIPRPLRIMRCIDMIEGNIRLTEGNQYFRMDGCVDLVMVQVSIEIEFGHFYTLRRKYGYF